MRSRSATEVPPNFITRRDTSRTLRARTAGSSGAARRRQGRPLGLKRWPMNERSSIEAADVARFAAVAGEWWDPAGKFAPLHRLNPARLGVIRDACLAQFGRDTAG